MPKALSITALVLFSLFLVIAGYDLDQGGYGALNEALGVAMIGIIFLIAYSIVGIVKVKNKGTVRTMSIVGVVLACISLIFLFVLAAQRNTTGAVGWGVIAFFYGIPYSIVALVNLGKSAAHVSDTTSNIENLEKLHKLFKSGAITEEEFNQKKSVLL